MLYEIGDNLEATPEEIAEKIANGQLVVLSNTIASKQEFLTLYRIAYKSTDKTVVYLADVTTELDDRYSPESNVKQYKDFIVVSQQDVKTIADTLVNLEEVEQSEESGE